MRLEKIDAIKLMTACQMHETRTHVPQVLSTLSDIVTIYQEERIYK